MSEPHHNTPDRDDARSRARQLGAAVGAVHQAALLKPRKVAANAGRGRAQQFGQFIDRSASALQQHLQDSLGSLICFY